MMIGEVIKKARLSKGIKAKFMASELGIHITSYIAIESGRRSLTVERAIDIANILGVSIGDLFCQKVSETLILGKRKGA